MNLFKPKQIIYNFALYIRSELFQLKTAVFLQVLYKYKESLHLQDKNLHSFPPMDCLMRCISRDRPVYIKIDKLLFLRILPFLVIQCQCQHERHCGYVMLKN